jgi:hypothetical protein
MGFLYLLRRKWQPGHTLVLLSFFTGILISLNFIKAQTLFLTHHTAREMVIAILSPMVLWYFCLQYLRKHRAAFRFTRVFYPGLILLFVLLQVALYMADQSPAWAFTWIFVAGLLSEFFRWAYAEFLERYVNPARIGSIFSYQSMAQEIGILTTVFFLWLVPKASVLGLQITVSVVFLILALVVYVVFSNPRRVEVLPNDTRPKKNSHGYYNFIALFLLLGTCLGVYRVVQDNLVNDFFKHNASSPLDLQNFINTAMFVGSVLQLSTAFISAKLVENFRISPVLMIGTSWIWCVITSALAIFTQQRWSYFLFASSSKAISGSYYSSLNQLTGSFVPSTSQNLRAQHTLGAVVIAFVIFSTLPHDVEHLIWIPALCAFFSFVILNFLKNKSIPFLEKSILSADPQEAVRAAVGLSFLHPKDFVRKMSDLLHKTNSEHLKKQILLGIGFSGEQKSVEVLLEEFQSDKEEIQITILDALKVSKTFQATRFTIDLVLSNRKTLTPRVRLNAANILVALYGKKSIPILMLGLSEEDFRQTANVLEALSQFTVSEVKDIFVKYVESDIPRVRANALIGLSNFKEYRQVYESEVEKTLYDSTEKDLAVKISILYVIGKKREIKYLFPLQKLMKEFIEKFGRINTDDQLVLSYIRTLSWALIRLGDASGYEQLWHLFAICARSKHLQSVLHFFVQLEDYERFDCIEKWILHAPNKDEREGILKEILESSGYNFMEEIEYLKVLVISTKKKPPLIAL